MRVATFGPGFTFLSACLGTKPQAPSPAPVPSIPVVGAADSSDTAAVAIYVLDGYAIPASALTTINPRDIAFVTLVKGPDAVASYGERARKGAIVITLVPPDARVERCRPPTPTTAAVASILVADLVRAEPYIEQGVRVDRHQSTWPMVRLFLKVRHGWKRNPLRSDGWHEGDTLIFNVTPDEDPKLPAGSRVLVYLQPTFTEVRRQAGDTAITTVEDTGFLELFHCHAIRRVEETQSDLRLLGPTDWQIP